MDKRYKPFLRWAGGKNWFVKYLPALLGDLRFNAYHEPFVGGGSVFFGLNPEIAFLSDSNQDLITSYIGIRDDVESVIKRISQWSVCEEQYYLVREMSTTSVVDRAARFIYLNHTSFNGIYRVNRAGKYNVPYGHRDDYQFDFARMRAASEALKGSSLACRDFTESINSVKSGDLVFLDPPYTVSHNNNGFIEYNKKLFSLDDQYVLKAAIDSIKDKGAYFILTNAAHATVKSIFEESGSMVELSRHCGLGGRNARRQAIGECVFTNIPNAGLEGSK